MSEQLVTFVLLWIFVLFRTPVPAVGDIGSGTRCTVQDDPLRNELGSTATCSDYGAAVSFTTVSNTQETSVDYVCTGEGGEMITGSPWTRLTSNANVLFTVNVEEQLQPGMNCTFYVCYSDWLFSPMIVQKLGREPPASCITDTNECANNNGGCEFNCINAIGSFNCSCPTGYHLDGGGFNCYEIDECATNNGGCEQMCNNTIGSFQCSCDIGYQLDENELNCNDIDECDNNVDNCDENASCTNSEGSFTCSCDPGYTGDGINCTNINECNTANGGCEHNCTDTIGSFNCNCWTGYQLDGNGLNCNDINECDNNVDNCDENANCTNTEGGFTCSCDPGYTGDGVNCTNVNECQMETYPCNDYANCTDTAGSFTCTCMDGFEDNGFNCISPSEATVIVVIIATAVAIIALVSAVLCVIIFAAHQFRREDTTVFTDKLYLTDVLDPKYFPVSLDSIPKLSTLPSMSSMYDTLCNTVTQISDRDTGSTAETKTTLDTILCDSTTETPSDTGHVNCQVPKDTDNASHDTFLVTATRISSTSYLTKKELCSNFDLAKEAQNDGAELALSDSNGLVVSDAHAGSHMSANYLPSGDATGTVTLKQNNDYIISEDLLVGSHCTFDLDGHVSESELPPFVGLETAFHNQQSLTFSDEGTKNQEYFQTNELQSHPGYLPNTHQLSSVKRNIDSLGCQSPNGSTSPSENRRGGLGTGMKSLPNLFSPSPHHCRTPSESSLDYFNGTMHNQLNAPSLSKMEYLSASSGYIIECSGSRTRGNGRTLP